MKHISEIIEPRRVQIEQSRQLNLFAIPQEKGSREWNMFNPIAHDHADAYRVLTPRARETPRYPNVVHINRYPRHLTVRFAR